MDSNGHQTLRSAHVAARPRHRLPTARVVRLVCAALAWCGLTVIGRPAAFGQARIPWTNDRPLSSMTIGSANRSAEQLTAGSVSRPNTVVRATSTATLPKRQFYAVLGAVRRPAVFSLAVDRPRVGELLIQAGGLTPAATGDVRIVRSARSGLRIYVGPDSFAKQARKGEFHGAAAERLMPNDILVVEPRRPRVNGPKVIAVGHSVPDAAEDAAPIQLGLLGVVDRPVIVTVLPERANIGTVLKDLGQDPQLARHVRVIPPTRLGLRLLPPERAADPAAVTLVTGDVLLLPRKLLRIEALPELPPPVVVTQWPPRADQATPGDRPRTPASTGIDPGAAAGQPPERRGGPATPSAPDTTASPAAPATPNVPDIRTGDAPGQAGAQRNTPDGSGPEPTGASPAIAAAPRLAPPAASQTDRPQTTDARANGTRNARSDGEDSANRLAGPKTVPETTPAADSPQPGDGPAEAASPSTSPSTDAGSAAQDASAPHSDQAGRGKPFFTWPPFPLVRDPSPRVPLATDEPAPTSDPLPPRPLGILDDPGIDLHPLPRGGAGEPTRESNAEDRGRSGSTAPSPSTQPHEAPPNDAGDENESRPAETASDADVAGDLGRPDRSAEARRSANAALWIALALLALLGAGAAAWLTRRRTGNAAAHGPRPHFEPTTAPQSPDANSHQGESASAKAANEVPGSGLADSSTHAPGGDADDGPGAQRPTPRPLRLEELLHGGVPIVAVAPEFPTVTQLAGRRLTTEPRRFDRPHRVRRPHTVAMSGSREAQQPGDAEPPEAAGRDVQDARPHRTHDASARVLDLVRKSRGPQANADRQPPGGASAGPNGGRENVAPVAAPHFLQTPIDQAARRRPGGKRADRA